MAAGREVSSADVAARFVELDGCFNVRDLGGTPPRTDVQCAAAGSTARMRCTASPPPATPGSPRSTSTPSSTSAQPPKSPTAPGNRSPWRTVAAHRATGRDPRLGRPHLRPGRRSQPGRGALPQDRAWLLLRGLLRCRGLRRGGLSRGLFSRRLLRRLGGDAVGDLLLERGADLEPDGPGGGQLQRRPGRGVAGCARAALPRLKGAEAGELNLVPGATAPRTWVRVALRVASTCARGRPVAAATASINCARFISSSTAVMGVLAVIVACRRTGRCPTCRSGQRAITGRRVGCRWALLEFAKPSPGQFRLSIATPLPGVRWLCLPPPGDRR